MRINWGWITLFAVALVLLTVWLTSISGPMRDAPIAEHEPSGQRLTHHLDRVFPTTGHFIAVEAKGFPRQSMWTGTTVITPRPFVELLPSMNVQCPPETGAILEVRTRDQHYQDWSPWLYIGKWGRTYDRGKNSERFVTRFEHGSIDTDTLLLDSPADAYEMRVTLQSFALPAGSTPTLRSVSVVTTGMGAAANAANVPSSPLDLKVPFIGQGTGDPLVKGEICSPTSTTMVLQFRGEKSELMPTCEAIYDDVFDMFGNWGRAVAYAGSLGYDAYLTRLTSLDEAYAMIARGQPLVLSIKFKAGEFPSNVQRSTGGHLIVLRGFTAEGDAICNDPADRQRGNGVIYKKAELEKAWQNSNGTVYVIGERAPTSRPS